MLTDGFYHGLGHGVGLEVHEPPALGIIGEELIAGDVITLEPGLYRQGFGGVRVEDLLLVTEDGYERLTDCPYELELSVMSARGSGSPSSTSVRAPPGDGGAANLRSAAGVRSETTCRNPPGARHRHAAPRGAALSAARGVRRPGERAARDLRHPVRGVLGAGGSRAGHLVRAVRDARRVEPAVREVVRRREAERRLQLPRPPRRGRARRQGRVPLRGRARGRAHGDHVRPAARRGREGGERAARARRRQGDAGRDLHGHGAGPAGRDARLRADRRAVHRRLRRLLRGGARRPAQRHALRDPAHPGRELPARVRSSR